MQTLLESRFRNRWWYLVACLATVLAGLASRRFPQAIPSFMGKYPGDVLWAMMVFLGVAALFRKSSSLKVGLMALGFSFGIEVLKLWQAAWLVDIRHTTVGHLIFGHVFSWQNLVAYSFGVLLCLIAETLSATAGLNGAVAKTDVSGAR